MFCLDKNNEKTRGKVLTSLQTWKKKFQVYNKENTSSSNCKTF